VSDGEGYISMLTLIAFTVANAILMENPTQNLDDIIKKYDTTYKQEKAEDSLHDFIAKLHAHDAETAAPTHDSILDAIQGHPEVPALHHAVTGMHSQLADMLSEAVPTDTPVLHPESPLSHDDRFAEILKGLKDIGHHHALAHLSKPDTDDAKSEEDEEGPKKPKVPKGKVPGLNDDEDDDAEEDDEEKKDPADTPKLPKPADLPQKNAAPSAADDEAPADEAPAEEDEEASKAKARKEALSPEKKAMLAKMEAGVLGKMGKSLKMMVLLHVLVKPMEAKLTAAMEHMPKEEAAHAADVLSHIQKLDKLTAGAIDLMEGVKKAAHGTGKEKAVAVMKLLMGLAKIEKGVKENLVAMKAAKAATEDGAPALGAGEHKLPATTKKLHHLLKKMEAKVAQELADPALKDSPQVAVDVKMLATMKTAVKKSEALVLVAAIALKKAKTEEDRLKVKTAVKGAMHKVMAKLKTDVAELKDEAAAVAMQKLKGVNAKKESADSDVAAATGEDAQTDESTKAETDDSATEKTDDSATVKTDKSEKAEDTAEKKDESEKEKDTDAKSDEDASAAYPEDGDKWIFKHEKPKGASKGAPEDAKAAETPEKEDAAVEEHFKPAQDDFMKKLKEDLLKLKQHFPAKTPAPETADTKEESDAEKPAQDSYMKKLEEDMKHFREGMNSASAPPKLEKESAELAPDAKIEQLRQKFAAKMAEFQHDHDGVEAATAPYADPEQSMQDQLLSMKDSMMHGRAPDVSSMEGLISNPIMQMAMKQVAQHPEIVKDAMAHDPMLQAMVAKDPRVAAMMENPDTLRMLTNPAALMQNLKELKAGSPSMPVPIPSEGADDTSDALGKLMAKLHASHLRKN